VRNLRVDEEVVDAGGRRLGHVQRLVVDEQANQVTHLVVEDRLVGIGHVRDRGDGLVADLGREELLRQPEARRELVDEAPAHWIPPDGYALRNFLRIASALIGQGPYVPPVHLDLDLSAVHEITPGSRLWHDGEQVGEVARVDTDDSGRVAALVIRRPGVFGQQVVLPSGHVTEVVGNNVFVNLDERELGSLPEAP
jgi:sporulation protein YlmC with PRC-barrel domain